MWLLTRLSPDFKTIADFRKDNGKGIKAVCRTFVQMCRKMNMFADSLFAIDGSKFKAVNSKDNNYIPSNVKYRINRIEENIAEYLSNMDTQDKTEKSDNKASPSKLEWFQKRLAELRFIEEEVNAHPDKQVSKNDPDARLLLTRHLDRQVCYNVQTAVDTKHHLIVSHDIDKAADRGQLTSVAKQVQQAMNKKDITVLADKGYFSRLDIKASHDLGITANVPQTDTSGSARKGIFNKSLFRYDKDKDVYICPAGETLQNRFRATEKGVEQDIYFNNIACSHCEIRAKCTQSKKDPRRMRRWIHEPIIDAMQKRLDDNRDIPVLRKQTVEHPFGTIKMWMGAQHFLMTRKHNVLTEMSIHVLAYNLKRMMSIMGVTGLISAMTA